MWTSITAEVPLVNMFLPLREVAVVSDGWLKLARLKNKNKTDAKKLRLSVCRENWVKQ